MDAQRAASGRPLVRLSPPLSLGIKAPRCYLVRLSLGVLLGAGGCPGASISDLCAIGGGSYFGLGWGWALLVYWRHHCALYVFIVASRSWGGTCAAAW